MTNLEKRELDSKSNVVAEAVDIKTWMIYSSSSSEEVAEAVVVAFTSEADMAKDSNSSLNMRTYSPPQM